MKRREVLKLLGGAAAAAPFAASAQPAAKTLHLVSVSASTPITADGPVGKIVLASLAEHGFSLGQNLTYDAVGISAQVSRLPQVMHDLAAANVDAVFVAGYPPAAAMKGTGIPTVVATGAGDPVATGLVASLARPGGNITGISDDATMLSTKRLSLLKQAVPNLRKVAMLWNKNDQAMTLRYKASADAAKSIGAAVMELGVGEPDDFNDVFAMMDRERPDAVLMVADGLTVLNRKRVFDYAAAHKLPAIYESDAFVRDGGLMSYGADLKETFARAGALLARVLHGEKPADLPFEEPTHYLFVVNLKVAKATGIDLPPTVLALADQVIE
jgi:putative ABC transport system substrate-binding protein